jgi:ammonium transporter, Amt family
MATWLFTERYKEGRVTSLGGASGAIAGLAAVTPAAGFVNPMVALLIGALAGVICLYATHLKFVLRYDDALDVVGVHLVGGVLGTILLGLFANAKVNPNIPNGVFFGGGAHLLVSQLLGVGVVFVYTFIVTFAIAKAIHATIGMRVSPKEEDEGLDMSEFFENAYDTPQYLRDDIQMIDPDA